MHEYQLAAIFGHHCQMAGAPGSRIRRSWRQQQRCVLHYVENSKPLNDGDLVLSTPGCEIECCASDITRTYPVNGRFSEPQRILYELVLEAQVAAIDKARVGNHWNDHGGRGAG